MSTLRIRLFGNVRVTCSEKNTDIPVPRALQPLLSYLLLDPNRFYQREILADLFWSEHSEESARKCLRTALWRLRKILEPDGISRGTYLVTNLLGEIGFNSKSDYWLDVSMLEKTARQWPSDSAPDMNTLNPKEIEMALECYHGDFLEGFYDEWVIRERERLRLVYLKSLAHLMEYYKYHGDYEKSLACGHRILNYDSLREEIHREMMRLYMATGQRTIAIRQFRTCCRILKTELDVSPMEETISLYNNILSGTEKYSNGPGYRDKLNEFNSRADNLQKALEKLSTAMYHFQKSQEQMHQSKELIEKSMENTIQDMEEHETGRTGEDTL